MLSIQGIRKEYGAVTALQEATLNIEPGTVHALLGANGSGKSTLVKILGGVVRPNAGTVTVNGQTLAFGEPDAARQSGITVAYQETSLVPQLTVAENMCLGIEPVGKLGYMNSRQQRDQVNEMLHLLDIHVSPDSLVSSLPSNVQHLAEIGKSMIRRPKYLILDEATASLHYREVTKLFEVIRKLREEGLAVLFVSHRFEEIFSICDKATVLRNGKVVGSYDLSQTTQDQLVETMIGEISYSQPTLQETASSRESIVSMTVEHMSNHRLKDVSFEVKQGEILGISGLQGQGQTELLRSLIGMLPASGQLAISNYRGLFRNPHNAVRHGVRFVSGDRAREGVFPGRSVLENVAVGNLATRSLFRSARTRRQSAELEDVIARLKVVLHSTSQDISSLSGGNQQKILFARTVLSRPKVVLLDDPTKGVDIATRQEIHRLLREIANEGVGLLVASSDDEELASISDRILIFYDGKVAQTLKGPVRPTDITEASIHAAQSAKEGGDGQ